MMVPVSIVHEKTVGEGRCPFLDSKKERAGMPICRDPCARCTSDLGNPNNILKQEVRLYVFLSGQPSHFCPLDPDIRTWRVFSIIGELKRNQRPSGESSARMDPGNDEG